MVKLVEDQWTEETLAEVSVRENFRIRGGDVTRLETFTDAAFAFAVTLLVISVDSVPSSFVEFEAALLAVPAFFVSFLQLVMFWIAHRRWSELFGLDDIVSIWLSFFLIAGVLVLVYPLRVLASLTLAYFTDQWLPSSFEMTFMDLPFIFIFYGVAFAFLSATILMLYIHAYRNRDHLALNAVELADTRAYIISWAVLTLTGVCSAAIAYFAPPNWTVAAGFVYSWLGIVMPYIGWQAGRQHARLVA